MLRLSLRLRLDFLVTAEAEAEDVLELIEVTLAALAADPAMSATDAACFIIRCNSAKQAALDSAARERAEREAADQDRLRAERQRPETEARNAERVA